MKVKVAIFRDSTDHIFRLINVDYHACVGTAELRTWVGITERVLSELSVQECRRANADDLASRQRSLFAARERLARCQDRIAHSKAIQGLQ